MTINAIQTTAFDAARCIQLIIYTVMLGKALMAFIGIWPMYIQRVNKGRKRKAKKERR